MSEVILETRGLTKVFGGLVALDKVDLSTEAGKISAIIGPNGAGKTTLFNLITGVYPASEGEIYFRGTPLRNAPAHKRAELGRLILVKVLTNFTTWIKTFFNLVARLLMNLR
ncbi:MAG: ATP-binding cassette domain-containing protein [Dehalococcoidia bacterium]|nr:ATP-binding cassette domain-containing protein [Dehalococcoidia bacterium]